MRKSILGALIFIAYNASYADETPMARIVTWQDMKITYQIKYFDKNNSLCYPTAEGTFRQPETSNTTYEKSAAIYKDDLIPSSCTHANIHVKTAYEYCEGKE